VKAMNALSSPKNYGKITVFYMEVISQHLEVSDCRAIAHG